MTSNSDSLQIHSKIIRNTYKIRSHTSDPFQQGKGTYWGPTGNPLDQSQAASPGAAQQLRHLARRGPHGERHQRSKAGLVRTLKGPKRPQKRQVRPGASGCVKSKQSPTPRSLGGVLSNSSGSYKTCCFLVPPPLDWALEPESEIWNQKVRSWCLCGVLGPC